MSAYEDRYKCMVPDDAITQGTHVKLPCFEDFLPLYKAQQVDDDPDILHIVVNTQGVSHLPENENNDHPSVANYFAHKSQVIFRILSNS